MNALTTIFWVQVANKFLFGFTLGNRSVLNNKFENQKTDNFVSVRHQHFQTLIVLGIEHLHTL